MFEWLNKIVTSLFGSKPGTSAKQAPASITGLTKPVAKPASKPADKKPTSKKSASKKTSTKKSK